MLTSIFIGRAYIHSQEYVLSYIPPHARILLLGGGSGKLLLTLLTTCDVQELCYVEASPVMLKKAQMSVEKAVLTSQSRIQWCIGNHKLLKEDQIFDIVITPFVLDIYPVDELVNIIRHLNKKLKKGGYWLYTDFVPPSDRGFHYYFQSMMYSFFQYVSKIPARSMPHTRPLFSRMGYELVAQKEFFYKGIESVVYQKLT